MATMSARGRAYDSDYPADYEEDRATGWIAFAGIMLGLVGAWNIFDGILALANSKVYAVNATYVFSDLRTWGWIVLVAGVLQVLAAFGIFSGNQLARWFGIASASVGAIVQLMFVPAAPFWSLSMFAVDLLVVYGLAVYGGRPVEAV